ncbi:MAG: hypothetical protein AB1792_10265 [Candidatus Zixiibacteriota bacterium]
MPSPTTIEPIAIRDRGGRETPVGAGFVPPGDETPGQSACTVLRQWKDPAQFRGRKIQLGIEYDGHGIVAVAVAPGKPADAIAGLLVESYEGTPSPEQMAQHLRELIGEARPNVHIVLATARAIVRRFRLPPVPARQRQRAALWEGQKLIPFPLNDQEALHGMCITAAGAAGWHVTLVAVPREDAAPILAAIDRLDGKLRSVSVVGTQRHRRMESARDSDRNGAVAVWSERRGAFSVFRDGQLTFHFDLGPMPSPPSEAGSLIGEANAADMRRWIKTMGTAIGDAFDFHLNVDPNRAPEHLTVIGLPAAVAPLVTDWQSRFAAGIEISNPIDNLLQSVPDDIAAWLHANAGDIAPALHAACGGVAVDLTPGTIRQSQLRLRLTQLARGACLISLVAVAASSWFLWAHGKRAAESLKAAQSELMALQASQVARNLASAQLALSRQQNLLTVLKTPLTLMPWLKTVLATLPENGRLTNAIVTVDSLDHRVPEATLTVRLVGTMTQGGLSHTLTYRDWADRLESLTGRGRVRLLNERMVDGQGQRLWAFTVQLQPLIRSVTGGDK